MADNDQQKEVVKFPLEWHFPEDVKTGYATNFIVQHTDREFYLSFFDTPPPIILGTPEEREEQVKKMKSVRAQAVARVVISSDRMPQFIEVLQENWEKFQAKQEDSSED